MLKPLSLKNGLTVLRIPRTSNLCVIGFVIPTGYAIERFYYKPGIAYLVERLFSTGTDKHITKRELNRALEAIGARFFTQTSAEFTSFYLTVPSENQFKAVTMMAEIIQHSVFDPKDIETEKKAIIDEMRERETSGCFDTLELSLENIYSEYAYSQRKFETVEAILNITEEDLLDYLQRQFATRNSYLIVGGNFASKEISDQISTEWGFWAPKNKEPRALRHLNVEELVDALPKVLFKQQGGQPSVINAGFLLEEGVEPRVLRETGDAAKQFLDISELQEKLFQSWAEMLVINALLGQGISSRLWLKGVEEEALFDTVHSEIQMFSRSGFFHMSAISDNAQFGAALETLLAAADGLKKINVGPNELDRAKQIAKSKMILDHEDLLFHVMWLTENMIASGLSFALEDIVHAIEKVDANSLRKKAQQLFVENKFFLTALGTTKESSIIERLVQKYL